MRFLLIPKEKLEDNSNFLPNNILVSILDISKAVKNNRTI